MESIFSNITANLMPHSHLTPGSHLTQDCVMTHDCHEVTGDHVVSDNDELQEASMHPHDELQEASMHPHDDSNEDLSGIISLTTKMINGILLLPRSLCMRRQMCDFCNKECNEGECYYIPALARLYGYLSCETHNELAYKHANAFFHTTSRVLIEDVIKKYPFLNDLSPVDEDGNISGKVNVPRSNGDLTEGGSIVRSSSYDEKIFIRRSSSIDNNPWLIRISFEDSEKGILEKDILISDLSKSGIDQYSIDQLLEHLNNGFYKNDYETLMDELKYII